MLLCDKIRCRKGTRINQPAPSNNAHKLVLVVRVRVTRKRPAKEYFENIKRLCLFIDNTSIC